MRSLTEPRPTLMQYSVPMPGEDSIPRPEIWTYTRGEKTRNVRRSTTGGPAHRCLGRLGVTQAGRAVVEAWWWRPPPQARDTGWARPARRCASSVATGCSATSSSSSSTCDRCNESARHRHQGRLRSLEPQAPIYVQEWRRLHLVFRARRLGTLLPLRLRLARSSASSPTGEWRADAIIAVDTVKESSLDRAVKAANRARISTTTHLYRVNLLDGTHDAARSGQCNHTSTRLEEQALDCRQLLTRRPRAARAVARWRSPARS